MLKLTRRHIVDALIVTFAVAVALFIRVVPAYRHVMQGDRVVFAANDPWIHMRNAENVAAHWPFPSWFDPYRLAPEGQVTDAPLMDIAIAGVAKVTAWPLDIVGAWFPAVAGALIPIPVFLLMRRLFGRPEAAIAATIVAVLPGQLLQRSVLGYTDHHVVEALLSTFVLFFLASALSCLRGFVVEPSRLRAFVVLAGVSLGLYLLSWTRGAFFVLILLAWACVEIIARFWAGLKPCATGLQDGTDVSKSWATDVRFGTTDVTRVIAPVFAIALVFVTPVALHLPAMMLSVQVLVAGFVFIALAEWLVSVIPSRTHLIAAFAGLAVALVMALAFALPDLVTQARRFLPGGGSATVAEVQPLLFMGGRFTPDMLWSELTSSSVLALIGLVFLMRLAPKDQSPAKRLILVWSVVTIVATLAQARFAYYMAVSAAMLAAIASARLLWRGLPKTIGVIAVAAIAIYPNLPRSLMNAATPTGAPTPAWIESLEWIRTHTPEPFGAPNVYFARYQSAVDAPKPGYGVMVWWDYGWWMTRIARRPPSTNPTQVAVKEAARFYLATDERAALDILRARNAQYVISDRSMPMWAETAGSAQASQLEVMARWAEYEPSKYFELYFERGNPVFIYSEDYYRTMGIRLFAYGGKAYAPSQSTWAISTNAQKQILESRQFATHAEGVAFIKTDPKRWRLVGRHPLLSPIAIEPLTYFVREFSSSQGVDGPAGRIPEVAVFRVTLK